MARRSRKWPILIFGLSAVLVAGARAGTADSNVWVSAWLNAQTNLQTWSADFVQTRSLAALAQPLSSTGRIWFATPDRFRWELGVPAQTLALRLPSELVVIYPRLKRAERYGLGEKDLGPWRDALALLDAGFPRNRGELEARFHLTQAEPTLGGFSIRLAPKSGSARKILRDVGLGFDTNTLSLTHTEVVFSDGSKLRNDFSNARINQPLPEGIFSLQLGPEYKIIEPLNPRGNRKGAR